MDMRASSEIVDLYRLGEFCDFTCLASTVKLTHDYGRLFDRFWSPAAIVYAPSVSCMMCNKMISNALTQPWATSAQQAPLGGASLSSASGAHQIAGAHLCPLEVAHCPLNETASARARLRHPVIFQASALCETLHPGAHPYSTRPSCRRLPTLCITHLDIVDFRPRSVSCLVAPPPRPQPLSF
jgi:hypothetical protein